MGGVIATGSMESSKAGQRIFELGGNAVDAAVAATFTSFISEMMVVNLCGGGYAVVAEGQNSAAYDFFAGVPSMRDPSLFDFREISVDFGATKQPFFIGRASTGVPGVMAGLCMLAQEKGSMPLSALMEPAIQLAKTGFHVTAQFAQITYLLTDIFGDTPELKALFSCNHRLVREGDFIAFPQMAHTLTRLAAAGPDLFYKGAIAQALAADHAAHGGRITLADMTGYQVHKTPTISVKYRDYEVLLPPPSSLGGSLIGFTMNLLRDVSLKTVPHNSSRHIEILAHVMRSGNRAREAWDTFPSGDARVPAFFSHSHLDPHRDHLHQALDGQEPPQEPVRAKPGAGNTSHISAIDDSGLAVSITTTAGENAGYVLGDTGLALNNILGELDLNPKGFHVQTPGDRMMSMMAPTIVCYHGKPVIAVGSAGSNRLRSAIFQTISNIIDFGMTPEQAINAPRVHHEDGILHLEGGVSPSVAQELEEKGFQVKLWTDRNLFFGGAQAVTNFDGQLKGGADKRRGGAVLSVG